jgi:hypothetical protein
MKKIFAVLTAVVLCLMFAIPIVSASGIAGFSQQVTLMSAATGTTAAVLKTFTFDYPVSKIACDITSGPTATTENITFSVSGNQGTSTTLFDTGTVYLITAKTVATSTTLTVMKSYATVDVPFRTMSASITSPTYTTNVIGLTCTGMQ